MEEVYLKVRMFGGFTMEYMGRPIAFERNTMTKTNQLMQILLQAGEKGIARDKLLNYLFGREEVTNPSNSLRATVFRLRKLLVAAGLPEDDYVVIKSGIYRWTDKIPVELDTAEFDQIVENVETEENPDKRYELLKRACMIYRGEFLPQLGAEEWAVILNVRYKNKYSICMNELCQELKQRREYEELLQAATAAVSMYPLEEWQIWQIDSLIALGRSKEAIKVYEDTATLLFEELGITPSERMMDRMTQLGEQIQNRPGFMEDIKAGLNEEGEKEGAFYCSYPSFAETYRFIKRMIERTGQSAYLLLCTITDGKGYPLEKGERLEAFSEELDYAIRSSLRKGDLYTKYSANQYLMLLLEIKQEDCEIVIKRINGRFESPTHKNYLKYNMAPISEVMETAENIHFGSMKEIWK